MSNTVSRYCAHDLMTGLAGVGVGEQGVLVGWDEGEFIKWKLKIRQAGHSGERMCWLLQQ